MKMSHRIAVALMVIFGASAAQVALPLETFQVFAA
jgi:hypothetical protein